MPALPLGARTAIFARVLTSFDRSRWKATQRLLFVTVGVMLAIGAAAAAPATAANTSVPRLLFGLGPEADGALASPFTQSAPVHLLTSWYNSPNDLGWITGWHADL